MATLSDDIIAKGSYRNYIGVYYQQEKVSGNKQQRGVSQGFKDLIKFLKNLTANHPVIRFTEVTLLYEERLHERNFHESFIN